MIPVDRPELLVAGGSVLSEFAKVTNARGRFIAIYLGLRRMGTRVEPLGSSTGTPAIEIERFLDDLYTKTHRPEPLTVLTAMFGGSTSTHAPYSTRTGGTAPGNAHPTNTWRNNFGIQKGIGCPAEADTIQSLVRNPNVRLACPHIQTSDDGIQCTLKGTTYRGEEHSIWLRMTDDGYQVVNLDEPLVYERYLLPGTHRIPIFALMASLYSMAPASMYPVRDTVSIPDFADDFAFDLSFVQSLFDCDPDSERNSAILAAVQDGITTVLDTPAPTPEAVAPALPELGPAVQLNSGVGAEIAVGRALQAADWDVAYRANQRNLGYDLEARKDGSILRVEVKSSVSFTTPELTESEWSAAQQFGDEFILAVVDFFGSEQQAIWYVRNPAGSVVPIQRTVQVFRLPRGEVQSLSTDVDFL